MRLTNLDMDVLRTLTLAVDHGGFGKAASIIGRSQSAVSLQMRRLEEQVGKPLFRREGRALVLNDTGGIVLDYGRRILRLNDEAITAISGKERTEALRLGLPADLSETLLTTVLAGFAEQFPDVQIETRIDRNANLVEQVCRNQLDLVLAFGRHDAHPGQEIAALPIHWISSRRSPPNMEAGIPLVLFDAPCLFRDAGIFTLDQAGLNWRVALTSPSLSGLWAATEAGLGISVRTRVGLPSALQLMDETAFLPPIKQTVPLSLYRSPGAQTPAIGVLRDIAMTSIEKMLFEAA